MSTSHRLPAERVPLAAYTTIGLGGTARFFLSCSSVAEIQEGLAFARHRSLPVLVLSGGSNIIVRDEGFDGLVLHIGLLGRQFTRAGSSASATFAAGEVWDACVASAVEQGYAGIECLSGIPGSAGATPIQNVGAYGQEVSDSIIAVKALDTQSGGVVSFEPPSCSFGYRGSRFKGKDAGKFIIIEVMFRLIAEGTPVVRYPELQRELASIDLASFPPGRQQLQQLRNAVLSLRKKKSMIVDPHDPHSRSCGSFFMNPVLTGEEFRNLQRRVADVADPMPNFPAGAGRKVSAAWLVEQAGFRRGFRRGNAGVSDHHSLALVNYGCTTRELLGLASEIEEGVFARFGVRLQKEPVLV
jgi:UDP-N-acetylmuramate dehydrogenase